MIFSENPRERYYEQLMQQPPNYKPKGGGTYLLQSYSYTAKDCECEFCLYFRRGKCISPSCPFINERIMAGVSDIKDMSEEATAEPEYSPFEIRQKNCPINSVFPFAFRNEKHYAAFMTAIGEEQSDNSFLAAVYLLTADGQLWNAVRHSVGKHGDIRFSKMHTKGLGIAEYSLLCSAKDLYLGTEYIRISDITNRKIVPDRVYGLICNAMAIRRFGLCALTCQEREN